MIVGLDWIGEQGGDVKDEAGRFSMRQLSKCSASTSDSLGFALGMTNGFSAVLEYL